MQQTRPGAGTFMWNELLTTDVDKARAFYASVLGWDFKPVDMGPMGTYWLVHAGGALAGGIGKLDCPDGVQIPPHWLGYVAVKDVNEVAKRAGEAVLVPPSDIPDVGRFTMVKDPSGAVVAFMTPMAGVEPKPANPPVPSGHFMWNELVSSDPAAAGKFLCGLTGWGTQTMPTDKFVYTLFTVGEYMAAGMMPLGKPHWADVPSHWMGYISVPDLKAAQAKVAANGGKVNVPPTPVPGIGTFIVITDPTGAFVSLMQPTPQQ